MEIKYSRRKVLMAGAGIGVALASRTLWAQAIWPERSIRLVVPFPPGGLIDNMARLIAPRLAKDLGQTVVVDNRSGAGGSIGASEVARSAADGYTLMMASPSLTISPAVYKTLPYQADKIEPLAMLGRVPNVLLVSPESGIETVSQLTERIKAKPGQMNYASNGVGTSLHLSAELYKSRAGLDIPNIPYRGAAAAIMALIGGDVDMMFDNLPSAIGQLRGGRIKALAVTTGERSSALPDVPTMAEAGVSGFNVSAWFGLAGPAGLPPAVVARLERSVALLAADPEVTSAMTNQGADAWSLDSRGMRDFMLEDAQSWKDVAKFANIQLD